MLDTGSPRVFNCNELTRGLLEKDPEARPFFQNKNLNQIVLIKDSVPDNDRRPGVPSVGTKLYFPFNQNEIYEGGRTIFLHNKGVERAIADYCGEDSVKGDTLSSDMKILSVLNRLPSLDPFLMKDVFLRESLVVNEAYFDVSPEIWAEIELYMLQKFEPLIMAAFPEAKASDDRAKQLIDKIWEAQDFEALLPMIDAFRLPREKALEIFSSWKGIVYYTFQYSREQARFIDLVKWLKENEGVPVGVPAAEAKEAIDKFNLIRDQLRIEWQKTDDIVHSYESAYDKMFKEKTSSGEFLAFLKKSDQIYWDIGNSLGKVDHSIYCWDVMTARYAGRKMSWPAKQELIRLLAQIMGPEKKQATAMSWS